MPFTRYPAMDKNHHIAFMETPADPRNLVFTYISYGTWMELGHPNSIGVIDAKNEVPKGWFSVYKGIGGGHWKEIAVVDSLSTAQALLNTMDYGKIKQGEVQLEVKNSHLNDVIGETDD